MAGAIVDIWRDCFHSNPRGRWWLNVPLFYVPFRKREKFISHNACLGIAYRAYIFITPASRNFKIYSEGDAIVFPFLYCLQVMDNHFAHNSLAKWTILWSDCGVFFFPFFGTIKHFIFVLHKNKWNCSHSSNGKHLPAEIERGHQFLAVFWP